jgi:hypothetical protein
MLSQVVVTSLWAAALTLSSFSVAARDAAPDISLEGLERVEKLDRGQLYADPNVDWSVYTEILLHPATVAFRKNWQRDQNRDDPFRVRNSDVQRIKKELAALFDEVFSQELTDNGGYRLTDQGGENVMRIEPQIMDLDIYAPETNRTSFSRSYTDRSGQMTLRLRIYDSLTGDLVASASDHQESPHRTFATLSNAVSNRADAQLMLRNWARALRERLDRARNP